MRKSNEFQLQGEKGKEEKTRREIKRGFGGYDVYDVTM